jgi:hypothetical protein
MEMEVMSIAQSGSMKSNISKDSNHPHSELKSPLLSTKKATTNLIVFSGTFNCNANRPKQSLRSWLLEDGLGELIQPQPHIYCIGLQEVAWIFFP